MFILWGKRIWAGQERMGRTLRPEPIRSRGVCYLTSFAVSLISGPVSAFETGQPFLASSRKLLEGGLVATGHLGLRVQLDQA